MVKYICIRFEMLTIYCIDTIGELYIYATKETEVENIVSMHTDRSLHFLKHL